MRNFSKFVREFAAIFWAAHGVLLALVALITLGAFLYKLAEGLDFWDSLYLAFITALTIGYGDFVPITPLGKVISVCIGFVGMIFIGLCVAVANVALKNTLSQDEG